jgi:hypothetical protein
MVMKGGWVEGGDNLHQYCYVGYVFRIVLNIGLFVSSEMSFICCFCRVRL